MKTTKWYSSEADMNELTHTDEQGKVNMVDVSAKPDSERTAEAQGTVYVSKEVYTAIENNTLKKGDVFATARIAGIQAAKKTSELIPLCHNIFISKVSVDIELSGGDKVIIKSFAKTTGPTGIEMEALTAVSVAALTIYDMCKAIDNSMTIAEICLLKKTGGKSGDYVKK